MAFEFLADREDEGRWTVAGEEKGRYWVADGQFALQVTLTTFPKEPSRKKVRDLWQERWNKQPSPVLLVAAWPTEAPERAMLCGPLGDDPSIVVRDIAQAERLARRALAEPSRAFAIQFLTAALAEVDDALPGVRNEGLLSSHELQVGVPARKDWADASARAATMLGRSGRELVRSMGYDIDRKGDIAVLRTTAGDEARAVAVFLDRSEKPDAPSAKFDQRTPVDMALLHARREGLRWVLAVRGSTLRLYSASTSGAAGQRGRTETFLELDLALLETQNAGYLTLLFAADALAEGGTFDEVASASRDFTTQLSERLRDQVYEHTVPRLAAAIAARHDGVPDKAALDGIYHAALTTLFRLLFIAYAEDRRLLPYDTSEGYRAASLKAIAQELSAAKNEARPLGFNDPFTGATAADAGGSSELWARCRTLFKAVEGGHKRWGIPAYGGGLFTKVSPDGQLIDALELTDAEFGPALMALIVDRSPDGGYGPIDFRSLSVREFGSIYEGLLENELAVAEQDLALKKDTKLKADVYVPAGSNDDVSVATGAVYLHNSSGARKSSGSYFTPAFAVDHLIGTALTPTLEEHLATVEALLDAGDDVGAAELLLDFRVSDISMGSGHFLTAAVDAIEAGITDLLARRPLPHFRKELDRLRATARSALGDAADSYEIEDSQLVRRLIARKCIYGVDLNPISVELARVSLWIHTFVPGLPLTFLDRTLIVGNSLSGIATIQEAVDALTSSGAQAGLFDNPIREALKAAEEPLRRLATISDATLSEVDTARVINAEAEAAVQPVRHLFDMIVAHRLGALPTLAGIKPDDLAPGHLKAAHDALDGIEVVHFPIVFPEVFLRERVGFDVILGNPPWEKPQIRWDEFWTRFVPGLRGMPQRAKDAAVLALAETRPDLVDMFELEKAQVERLQDLARRGPYKLGVGHIDYAKIFAWRFWALINSAGTVGVVLPRGAVLVAPGMSEWRYQVLEEGRFVEICVLQNNGGWVFGDVSSGYSLALVTFSGGRPGPVKMSGPFNSRASYENRYVATLPEIDVVEFRSWSVDAAFPLISDAASLEVYRRLAAHKRFGSERFRLLRPVQGDINSTTNKSLLISGDPDPKTCIPVYSGSSIRLLEPETGSVYGYSERAVVEDFLMKKRKTQAKNSRSAFYGTPEEDLLTSETLPHRRPRIVWRLISGPATKHTLVVALAPPDVVLSHGTPYLLNMGVNQREEAYVLGVLASSIIDWWAKLHVELNVQFNIFNEFPVPQPTADHPGYSTVVDLASRLSAIDSRFADWAAAHNFSLAPLDVQERVVLRARLDASVARLFGLSEPQVATVFESFKSGWKSGELAEYFARVADEYSAIDWEPVPIAKAD